MPPPIDKDRPTPGSDNGFRAPEALIAGMILGGAALGLLALVVSNTGLEWTWKYWGSPDGKFDRSVIFRNFGLLALALIALPLASWRSWSAHRQAHSANRQTELAEKGLIIDRYQKGAQMLESGELSVRIAGVYALRELALNDPEETYFLVLDFLYAFVREKSKDRKPKVAMLGTDTGKIDYGDFPTDLQIALEACTAIRASPKSANIEGHRALNPDLNRANLSGANFNDANLSNAVLWRANLCDATWFNTNLSCAFLDDANISNTILNGVDLSDSRLFGANLAGSRFFSANLTDVDFTETSTVGTIFLKSNLSGALLSAPDRLDDKTSVKFCWAFEDNPPRCMPEPLVKNIVYRLPQEAMKDFIKRMKHEQPTFKW